MAENATYSFNIENFKSALSAVGGIIKPNKFMVSLFPPSGIQSNISTTATRNLQFFCTGANLPGIELTTYDNRRYGYGVSLKKPWNGSFSPVRLNILLDASSYEWLFFKQWISLIFNFDLEKGINTNNQPIVLNADAAGDADISFKPYEVEYKDNYATDVVITSFRETGEPVINTVLRDAFPVGLSDIKLDWSEKDSHAQFSIYLTFTDWYISKTFIQENL